MNDARQLAHDTVQACRRTYETDGEKGSAVIIGYEAMVEAVFQLLAERDALVGRCRDALSRYGEHDGDCAASVTGAPGDAKCTCGYDAACASATDVEVDADGRVTMRRNNREVRGLRPYRGCQVAAVLAAQEVADRRNTEAWLEQIRTFVNDEQLGELIALIDAEVCAAQRRGEARGLERAAEGLEGLRAAFTESVWPEPAEGVHDRCIASQMRWFLPHQAAIFRKLAAELKNA